MGDQTVFKFHPAPPKFLEELTDTKVTLGADLKLKAVLDGYPQPTLKWTKDKLAISAPVFQFNADDPLCLTVAEATNQISGVYSITAKNIGGEAKTSCTVKVQGINWQKCCYLTWKSCHGSDKKVLHLKPHHT